MRHLSSGAGYVVAVLAGLCASADATEPPLVDDPGFLALLKAHEDRGHPAGKPFPALALECRFVEHAIADYVHYDEEGQPSIILSSIPTNWAGYKLFPSILSRSDGRWKRFPVPTTTDGWDLMHVSSDGANVVLLMDGVTGSGSSHSTFVLSRDGGQSWHYGRRLRKYLYFNGITYFTMDDDGHGTAVEFNDGGTGGYERVGYYVSQTQDWGETWTPVVYQAGINEHDYVKVGPVTTGMRLSRTALGDVDEALASHCVRPGP